MKQIKKLSFWGSCALLKTFFAILYLLCSVVVISCQEDDKDKEEVPRPTFSEEDIRHEEMLKVYLQNNYPCVINLVSVTEYSVKITGEWVKATSI